MAKITNLEIAAALANNPKISIKKSLFGLQVKAIYEPTQSPIKAQAHDYSAEGGTVIRRILAKASPESDIEQLVNMLEGVTKAGMGPFRMEMAVSADRSFLALQTFGFSDFQYKPLDEMLVIER